MPSFSIPLSGLQADSTALNTIANNLANMNTTAYKSQSASFSDLFYQQVGTTGSGNPLQVGTGTQVASISTDFTGGSPNSSGTLTNDALQGDGFFVVKGASSSASEYTRDGNFGVTASGGLTTQSGLNVMGYPVDSKGVVQSSAALVPLVIPKGQVEPAQATQNISLTGNLMATAGTATTAVALTGNLDTIGTVPAVQTITAIDSTGAPQSVTITYAATGTPGNYTYSAVVGGTTVTGALNYAGGAYTAVPPTLAFPTLADGGSLSFALNTSALTQGAAASVLNAPTLNGTVATAAEPVTIYDALGVAHVANVTFTKDSSAARTWDYNVSLTNPAEATGALTKNTGTISFDGTGTLVAGQANDIGVTIPGFTDGASPLIFNCNFSSASGSPLLTQNDAASSFSNTFQDGYQAGEYSSYAIAPDGVVNITYTNGKIAAVGQLAVAMVTNEQGLSKQGNGDYVTTMASGVATVGVAGTGGRGTMQGSSLEASNVDISAEFANLIVAQRAFEANSKAITTFDTISQDTIGMIR